VQINQNIQNTFAPGPYFIQTNAAEIGMKYLFLPFIDGFIILARG